MPAHLISTITVLDPRAWRNFVSRVAVAFAPHRGKGMLRPMKAAQLTGTGRGDRAVVLEVPDLADLRCWYDSPEHLALIAVLDADADLIPTARES